MVHTDPLRQFTTLEVLRFRKKIQKFYSMIEKIPILKNSTKLRIRTRRQ